jgi:hypothetical protein
MSEATTYEFAPATKCHYCNRPTEDYFGTPTEGGYCCDQCQTEIIRSAGTTTRGIGRIMDELAPNRDRTAGKVIARFRP